MPIEHQGDSQKISKMNDLSNQKAVEHNDLITSVAKMDKVPLKIFELAVSCLDTEHPPADNAVYLSKNTIYSFFDVSSSNKRMCQSFLCKVQKPYVYCLFRNVLILSLQLRRASLAHPFGNQVNQNPRFT